MLGKMCTRDVKTRTGGGDRQSFPRGAAIASQIKIFGFEPKRVIGFPPPPPRFFFSPSPTIWCSAWPFPQKDRLRLGKEEQKPHSHPFAKGGKKGGRDA